MKKHIRTALFVAAAMVTAALAGVTAAVISAESAHACSVVAPDAAVSQVSGISPGDVVTVAGNNFFDSEPVTTEPFESDVPDGEPRISLCDFNLVPRSVDIVWVDQTTQLLGSVDGPDFEAVIVVPSTAREGRAWIDVGGVLIDVVVGRGEPCPIYADDAASVRGGCEPEPCPMYFDGDGPEVISDWCAPEPCPMYFDGDGPEVISDWCAPEPCPLYFDGDGPEAIWDWCAPEPCPLYFDGDGPEAIWDWCAPEPCPMYMHDAWGMASADLAWCPPPEPCPFRDADPWFCEEVLPCVRPTTVEWGIHLDSGDCPLPEPCVVVFDDGWCPGPCVVEFSLDECGVPCPLYFNDEWGDIPEGGGDCPPPKPCAVPHADWWWCPAPCGHGFAPDECVEPCPAYFEIDHIMDPDCVDYRGTTSFKTAPVGEDDEEHTVIYDTVKEGSATPQDPTSDGDTSVSADRATDASSSVVRSAAFPEAVPVPSEAELAAAHAWFHQILKPILAWIRLIGAAFWL